MHKFVRNLLTEWRKLELPSEGETFIVAVSGGADSLSLAIALDDLRKRRKLRLRLVAAHFDHGLRGAESARDAAFVEEFSRNYDFELAIKKGAVPKEGNLEQNARLARYEFLIETARRFNAFGILTAHTVNDQAETFLLNLIRGSGIEGLSAMKPVMTNFELPSRKAADTTRNPTPGSGIALVRPLLNWSTRTDTENFCRDNQIEFRADAMNDDLRFKRVRVRKVLLPLLRELNPKIVETLAKTANLLQGEIEHPETGSPRPSTFEVEYLLIKDLKALPKPLLYRSLRAWLRHRRGSLRLLESKHVEAVERLVCSRKSGKSVELPAGETVFKEGGKLFLRRKNIENTDFRT